MLYKQMTSLFWHK